METQEITGFPQSAQTDSLYDLFSWALRRIHLATVATQLRTGKGYDLFLRFFLGFPCDQDLSVKGTGFSPIVFEHTFHPNIKKMESRLQCTQ